MRVAGSASETHSSTRWRGGLDRRRLGVAAELLDIGDRAKVAHLDAAACRAVPCHVQRIEESVDRVKTEATDVKLLASAFLVPDRQGSATANRFNAATDLIWSKIPIGSSTRWLQISVLPSGPFGPFG
jgi:hypothetical protein